MDVQQLSSPTWLSHKAFKFNAVLGLIGFLLVGAQLIGWAPSPHKTFPQHTQWLIANFIFLNTLHVTFTVVLLLATKEYAFRFKKVLGENRRLPFSLFLLSLFTFTLFITQHMYSFGGTIILLFMGFLPLYHVQAQQKGICLNIIKNHSLRNGMRVTWDYSIIYLLIATIFSVLFRQTPFLWALTASSGIVFGWLFLNTIRCLFHEGLCGWGHYLFQIKLLLYPFIFVSDMAGFTILCLHGVEYASVMFSILDPQQIIKNRKSILGVLFFSLLIIILTIVEAFYKTETKPHLIATSLLMSVVVVHYGLDGVLFRSKSYYS